MTRDAEKFMLRLPDGMRQHIAERAKENLRSMNAEIVHILTMALRSVGKSTTGQSLPAHPAADRSSTALTGDTDHHNPEAADEQR
ncbi:hypothetical protein MRF4_17320 [Methylobacterium radiotolerans]|uniref:Arc family DNA-binding protein n=1 Tax=Methylobacterium TaxID=407 RepID=UPI002F3422EE